MPTWAQVERNIRPPGQSLPVRDTIKSPATPSANVSPNPSTNAVDTLSVPADSTQQENQSDIETTIIYSARDSINSNLETQIVRLYGDAKITYGTIELEADQIEIDYGNSTISAHGVVDSLGRRVGFPIFKDAGKVYETKNMIYNFKTKRARITEVVTQEGDGFLQGEFVYKNDKNELFTFTNAYTTCNLPHPHFRILSRRSKAIPGDKIVSGPFYFEFNGIPTPLGFAFGIFPSKQKRSSGIIMPTFGEEGRRGFFLRQGGYFFDINDYVKLALRADLFSRGSSALYADANYRKRYKYSGAFNFTYTNNRLTDRIEDRSSSKDFRLVWSHSPQTKGTGRFSASVNAATTSYNFNNLLGVNANPASSRIDNVTRKLASNIAYSKTFPGTPFSLGVNVRHNQDLTTGLVDLSLPDVTFNVNNIYPFRNSSNVEVLENLSFRYTLTGTNQVTNNLGRIGREDANGNPTDSIAPFNFSNLSTLFNNARRGARHNIPLATSLRVLKHFTISPSLNYDELWYFERLNWRLNDEGTAAVVSDTIQGFNRIANYSGGVGLNTRIYGFFIFKNPNSKVKAIRHVINPSVSYSFQPDFGDPSYDYYQTFQTASGNIIRQSRHQGFVYGTSRTGRSSALGFSLNNTFDMKVQGKRDTVVRKIALLNTLSISSSYNFAADSFRLANFNLAANTNVLNDRVNINVTATVDPYQYIITSTNEETGSFTQRRVDQFVWRNRFSLGRISSANLALSTNLSPQGRENDKTTREKIAESDISQGDKEFLLANPDAYVDFTIPWNLRISYNVNYTRLGLQEAAITQALRIDGDVSLSEKWKIGFNTGYDFESQELTQTNISINRELHCWQMSLNWVPFGRFQSYSFTIGVKSSLLQDLKLDRQRSFFDN